MQRGAIRSEYVWTLDALLFSKCDSVRQLFAAQTSKSTSFDDLRRGVSYSICETPRKGSRQPENASGSRIKWSEDLTACETDRYSKKTILEQAKQDMSPKLLLRLEVPEEPTVAGLEGIHLGVGQTLRVQEVGSFRAKQSNVDPRSSTPEMDAHTRIGPFQSTYGTE